MLLSMYSADYADCYKVKHHEHKSVKCLKCSKFKLLLKRIKYLIILCVHMFNKHGMVWRSVNIKCFNRIDLT